MPSNQPSAIYSHKKKQEYQNFRPGRLGNVFSGLQKGPVERGHIKKRQKSSKSVKKFFDTFRQFSRRAKKRQKSSKNVKKFFDTFRQFSRGTFFPAPFGGLRCFGSWTKILVGHPTAICDSIAAIPPYSALQRRGQA